MLKKISKPIGYTAAAVALLLFLLLPFLFANPDVNSVYVDRNITAPVFYACMLFCSTALMIAYILVFKQKNIWVLLTTIAIFIVNTGYFAMSISSDLAEALLANRISYFGNVFMLVFTLFTLVSACSIKYKRSVITLLFSISVIMFFFSSTQGYLDIFYKNVEFEIVDGFPMIIKEYGFAHTLYKIYLLSYFLILLCTVFYAIKKKNVTSKSTIYSILIIVISCVSVWFIEQFTDNKIEFLSLTYVICEVMLMWLYRKMLKDGTIDTYVITMKIVDDQSEKTVNVVVENPERSDILSTEPQTNITVDLSALSDAQLRKIVEKIERESRLTEREADVAVQLLKNLKRKEIADEMFVSEQTIKTHVSHIYHKLSVSNKKEFFQKVVSCINIDETIKSVE